MAETLANILSGVPSDPTQVNPGFGSLGSLGQVALRALATAPYVMAEAARGGQDTGGTPGAMARAATAEPLAALTNFLGISDFYSPQSSFSALARQFGGPPSKLRGLGLAPNSGN